MLTLRGQLVQQLIFVVFTGILLRILLRGVIL